MICWFKWTREASLDNVKGQENRGRDLSSEDKPVRKLRAPCSHVALQGKDIQGKQHFFFSDTLSAAVRDLKVKRYQSSIFKQQDSTAEIKAPIKQLGECKGMNQGAPESDTALQLEKWF